jgi:ATP-dependent Zn protease
LILAKQTPGFSGADIANVCNEAAPADTTKRLLTNKILTL